MRRIPQKYEIKLQELTLIKLIVFFVITFFCINSHYKGVSLLGIMANLGPKYYVEELISTFGCNKFIGYPEENVET